MKEDGLLDALAALYQGKAKDQKIEVAADILLSAHNELKDKAQMRKELEMARDEAQGMKPSVARKLNEKIRALEAELDTLRTNKKVIDLEKKVKFLEQELKQSYTTKNFTLKSGLLELEKQYRAHMNVDPAMAAFWADVTVLLDEKKDKDSQPHFKGPPSLSASSTPRLSTSSQQPDGAAAAQQEQALPEGVSSSSNRSSVADATGPGVADETAAAGTAVISEPHQLQSHPANCGVQMQVEAFNSIISEEAAGAAALPSSNDGSSTALQPGDHIPRQAGSFRIVRAQQQLAAAPGDHTIVQDSLQPVSVLKESYSQGCKGVQFRPLPASLSSQHAGAVTGATQQQLAADVWALETCRDNISRSAAELQQLSSQLPADSSLLQQQLEQLGSSAQQLTAGGGPLQLQQQEVQQLMNSTQQFAAAWQQPSGSGSDSTVEAVAEQLHTLQQELQRLQQLQQQSSLQAQSQHVLMQVFEEFISQLEQQGLISGSSETAVAADGGQEHRQQRHMLVQLLQDYLRAHSHPSPPLVSASDSSTAAPGNQDSSSSAVGVPKSPETNHISIQAQVPVHSAHAETQSELLPSPVVHASTQAGAINLADAETRHENSHMPVLHVGVQAAAEHTPASTQAEGVESLHVETQSDPLPSPSSHAATQVSSELVSTATQADPPGSPVHAQVQAEMKPQVAEAALQVDLTAAADTVSDSAAVAPAADMNSANTAVVVDGTAEPADLILPAASQSSGAAGEQQQAGSGVIYSASGSELPVSKVAIGQQLDVLHELQQHSSEAANADADVVKHSDNGHHLSAVVQVKSEELLDVQAVAKELSQLRADNIELAASLQVTKSLVDHLNSSMKLAIDKADDAEAEAAHIQVQLNSATSSLQQLQSEHADLTKLLIEAKVEIAEKKGELLELVRNLRRAVEKPTSAAVMIKELQEILAVLPAAEGGLGESEGSRSTDMQIRPAATGISSVGALAGFAAGLGQAFGGGSSSRRSRAVSDGGSAEDTTGATGGRRTSEH